MANFLERNKLYCVNTFLKKKEKRKWTRRSPNFEYMNEIDCTISNNPNIIQDVTALNSVDNGSDHQLVGGILKIQDVRMLKRVRRNKSKLVNPDKLILKKRSTYQNELKLQTQKF